MGPRGWTIQSKLQIYMWLGILKHKKEFCMGLPKGFEMSHEIKNADRPRSLPPNKIHYIERHTFQLRAHVYQARSLIGSDASGLSDPFALIIVGEFSKVTQVIDETLSPTWDELLVFDEILIYGTKDDIEADPPSIIIEIFDQDKVGKSEFIGRTMAKPHVKLFDVPYTKPKFPPPLEWYQITRGSENAGELLATFELLELSPNNDAQTLPNLPEAKAHFIPQTSETEHCGPILPIPRGIRPTLAKYRIEVLFWGLRDLKRIHLLSVNKPRVDIECSGHILYSSVIQNAKKNPNFPTPVKFLELELPEQELYRPPLTIRVVDCRSFGRYTLVGTHMINSIHKYMFNPMTKREREAEERKRSLQLLQPVEPNCTASSPNLVLIDTDRERSPLIPKDTNISLTAYGTSMTNKATKTETNKRRKQSEDFESDDDEQGKDWWTKYFASVEATAEEAKHPPGVKEANDVSPYHEDGEHLSEKSAGEPKKKLGLRTAGNAAKFVSKISPKHCVPPKPKKKLTLCKVN